MSRLFDRNYAYPCDDVGPYVEIEGTLVSSKDGAAIVEVPGRGRYTVYNEAMLDRFKPDPGDRARIRVYDAGGGFYPDDKLVCLERSDVSAVRRRLPRLMETR